MSQLDPTTPVTVLGAGIVGICTALSLLERGVPVTLIDKGAPGQETSYGNAGVVSPWSFVPQAMPGIWKDVPKLMFGYGRPFSIRPASALQMIPWGLRFLAQTREDQARANMDAMAELCAPSIGMFEKYLRGTGHEDLLQDAIYLQAYRKSSDAHLDGLANQVRAAKGADMEVVGRDRLHQIEPALSQDFTGGVLIKGSARVRSPGRVAEVLSNKARQLGAEIVQTEVTKLTREGEDWTLHCTDGPRQAKRLVISMGVWSTALLSGLGVSVPLISERGYHVEFAEPGIELNNSVMDTDAKFIASSMEGGVRAAGQAEFAPADAPPSKARERMMLNVAKAAFPDLQTGSVKHWMGRRPSFPDSLPVIDQVAQHPGLFLNFGHSHYGLMMSPASGELVAQMICGTRPNIDVSPYSTARFG